MENIIRIIEEAYENIEICEIEKICISSMNKVFLLKTPCQLYVLKVYHNSNIQKVKKSIEIQLIIHKHLLSAPLVLLNKKGEYATAIDNDIYVLHEYIQGEYPDTSFNTIEKVARELSTLHQVLEKNIYYNTGEFKERSFDRIISKICECEERLIQSNKLNGYNEFVDDFRRLLELRKKVAYDRHICYTPKICKMIHGDVKPSNIIIDSKNGRVIFIDFDYSFCNDLIVEIGRAAILVSNFNINKTIFFIEKYFSYLPKYQTPVAVVINQLLEYMVQNNSPINIYDKLDVSTIKSIVNERIKLINFCINMQKSV